MRVIVTPHNVGDNDIIVQTLYGMNSNEILIVGIISGRFTMVLNCVN